MKSILQEPSYKHLLILLADMYAYLSCNLTLKAKLKRCNTSFAEQNRTEIIHIKSLLLERILENANIDLN